VTDRFWVLSVIATFQLLCSIIAFHARKTATTVISFFRAYKCVIVHWRAIILPLILALATFLIAQADFFALSLFALLLIFIASQLFWIGRILDLGERFIRSKRRTWLAIIAGLVYLLFLSYCYPEWAMVTQSAPPTTGCRA
jgi:hypothetical protein